MMMADIENLFPIFPTGSGYTTGKLVEALDNRIISAMQLPDIIQHKLSSEMNNRVEAQVRDAIHRKMLNGFFDGVEKVEPVVNTGTSTVYGAIQEVFRKVQSLIPETHYVLTGQGQFKKLLVMTGARVTSEYMIGPHTWVKIIENYFKVIVNPIFEVDSSMYRCSREFFNNFLKNGEFDPETEKFTFIPISE